jgi:hypothetical protein
MASKQASRRIKRKLSEVLKGSQLVMRMVDMQTPVRAVIATENPIAKYDEETQQVVREVLLMDGVEYRSGRNQIPIVDSHDDRTVRNIFGSIQKIQANYQTGELIGVPVFASDSESQTIAQRMTEGHITDFSITAIPLETTFVARGKSFTTSRGEVIEGPALIHTRWQPINASICATGADEHSTVIRSYTDLKRKVTRMDEALLGQLSSMGLPAGMTDPNQVLAWVVGKLGTPSESEEMPMVENAMETPAVADAPVEEPKPEEVANSIEAAPVARSVDVEAEIRRALEKDQKRRSEIQAVCKLSKIERAYSDELCDSGISLDEARKRIIERMATQPLGTSVGADVRVTGDGSERFYKALGDGLVLRSMKSGRIKNTPAVEKDAEDFANMPMKRAAELILRQNGVNTDRMSDVDICKIAMGSRAACRAHRVERAYHTTGSFANLLLDAANKTLLAAYEESPQSWNMWARQAPSVADFKNINRIRFSESPNPEMVPEKQPYKEKAMSDSKESYKVEKYGALFTVSWETVVNDDLDAIGRVPAMHGNACRRKVNSEVYSVLTSNPVMGDTVALFGSHASGTNLSGASANPSVTTLNAAFAAMRTQKGLTSDAILNIVPRYLIVPVALEATALELVNSTSYIVANGNQGVQNIYGVGGVRSLTVIGEPVLDGNSTAAWYLAADPSQVDTVEVSFLQGEESPVLEDEWDFDTDVYKYKVRQTFGVKAIDWRGMYKYFTS